MSILNKNSNYSFRSYFELSNDTDEILAEFDYAFTRQRLKLPKTNRELQGLTELFFQKTI